MGLYRVRSMKNFSLPKTIQWISSFIIVFFATLAFFNQAQANEYKMTATFPSVKGIYKDFILSPQQDATNPPYCASNMPQHIGSMYFNRYNELLLCGDDGEGDIRWNNTLGLWIRSNVDPLVMHTRNLDPFIKVGLGLQYPVEPTSTLHIAGGGTFRIKPSNGSNEILFNPIDTLGNAGMKLWGVGVNAQNLTKQQYIDFHAGLLNQDYNARILYSNIGLARLSLFGRYLPGNTPDIVLTETENVSIGTTDASASVVVNGNIKVRNAAPAPGEILIATDNNGTTQWSYPVYAPE